MFLSITKRLNPKLLEAAFKMHQELLIGPNTYVIDLDVVSENAKVMTQKAKQAGLELYLMSKQYGRNPLVTKAAGDEGLEKIVAVDVDEAKKLASLGVPLGNVGHLVQIPRKDLSLILSLKPEVMTVFSFENAEVISMIAEKQNCHQDLLLRVRKENDFFFPGQEGGIYLDNLMETYKKIENLPNVEVIGVTSHPCLLFNYEKMKVESTPNLDTIIEAGDLIEKETKKSLKQINAPSVTTTSTMDLLKKKGVTHGEPGSSLTGTTPIHAYFEQPEIPGIVYVSEISHVENERVFFFGGGLYVRAKMGTALVGRTFSTIMEQELDFIGHSSDNIDYYGSLRWSQGKNEVRVGDTVLAAFRPQIFVGRSRVAIVSGIQKGTPQLIGTFDQHGNLLNEKGVPTGEGSEKDLLRTRGWD